MGKKNRKSGRFGSSFTCFLVKRLLLLMNVNGSLFDGLSIAQMVNDQEQKKKTLGRCERSEIKMKQKYILKTKHPQVDDRVYDDAANDRTTFCGMIHRVFLLTTARSGSE